MDALLPTGVTLEFDGRWRAMLSHETKNYALLGYGGELALRGAAFTSSRSERYGRVFLEEALKSLLGGEITRIPPLYRATVERLQAGGYTNAEVASRARVNKSQDEYLQSSKVRQEAVYEGLLRSGQLWKSGDRVLLYQRSGSGLSVLDDPEGCDYDAPFYAQQLLSGYASRLKKGLSAAGYAQVFAQRQPGLFDRPLSELRAVWDPVPPSKASVPR